MEPFHQAVVDAAEKQRGSQHCDELRDALNAIAELPKEQALALRLKIAESMMSVESPAGAGLLAIWLGASVEQGIEPEPTIVPILKTLLRWTDALITLDADPNDENEDDDDLEDPEPDDEVLTGTELLGQSLVAHLSRANESRLAIAEQNSVVAELERVEHLTAGAMWVLELLRKCNGHVTILHAELPVGVRVAYENLSNCFHLFTLLQGLLADVMPGSEVVNQALIDAATGETHDDEAVSDNAWWHYGQGNVPLAELGGSVFGEASPASIATIEGEQVMLLWPPILQGRSWNSGFFGPVLSSALPRVSIKKTLSPDDVQLWRAKIGLPSV